MTPATASNSNSFLAAFLSASLPVRLFSRLSHASLPLLPLSSHPQQWIWTTLNLGALGTIALTFFHDDGFPYRLIVVAIAWLMGLFFALYGLRQFHLRRKALLSVTDDPETWESPNAPAIVVAAFVIMMLTIIVYAIASGQQFGFRTRAQLYGGTSDQ